MTRIKTKDFISWVRFWVLTILASKSAQKEEGVLFCGFKNCNEYHHNLTVWETENNMKAYRASAVHLKAKKYFS